MGRGGRTGGLLLCLVAAGGAPAAAQVAGESEGWVFSGTARETVTDNLFLAGPDTPTEVISGATLSLAYARRRRQTSFSAMGWVNGALYSEFKDSNGVQYGFGLSGQDGLDRRARWRYQASYSDGLNLEALYASRVGVPQVDVKSFAVSTGFSYNITPDTFGHLSLDGSALRYRAGSRFASSQLPGDLRAPPDVVEPTRPGEGDTGLPTAPDGSVPILGELAAEGIRVLALDYWSWRAGAGVGHAFSPETKVSVDVDYRRSFEDAGGIPDGQLLGATVGVTRALDPTANLSLGYTFEDAHYGIDTQTHSLVGRVTKAFGKTVRGDLSLGTSYFVGPTNESSTWDFIGGAGVSVQLKRSSLVFRYNHARYQGVIGGRSQVTDDAFGSLGHAFGKKVFGAVFGFYRNARDEFLDLYSYNNALGGTSITVRIEKRWHLGASYSYSYFGGGVAPGVDRSVFSVSLGYTRVMK